jgi:molybdopterin molybdotransferase
VGKLKVSVYRSPSIAVIITGSEIVEPELIPGAGQIRNSNGPQLVGQLKSIALEADDLGIVLDIREEIKEKIICAIEDHDLVIISGGISVGDYDYVPGILDELGFRFLFSRISSKPGKHTILANKGNCYIFCLPGNPVSSFVQFEVLGKSLIYKLMGADFKPVKFSVKLSADYMRQYSDCSEIIPVRINREGEAELLPYHGSSHIHALAYASALMEIPLGTSKINQGDTVYVRPL